MNAQDIMAKRKTDAIQKIEGELWKGTPDPEAVADAAIKGGLTPGEVAGIEARIGGAKATLADLAGIDLASLKRDGEAALAATREAQRIADAAQAEADRLAAAAREAAELFEQAVSRIRAAALEIAAGALPADRVPASVKQAVEFDRLTDERERLEQGARAARHMLNQLRGQQQDCERVIDELTHNRGAAYPTLAGVKSAKETHERQLADLQKSIAQFEADLPKLEKRAAAAGVRCREAQAFIIIEPTA